MISQTKVGREFVIFGRNDTKRKAKSVGRVKLGLTNMTYEGNMLQLNMSIDNSESMS